MANLFVDGNNGKFNETADPEGNPPSDWNVDKDESAVLGFENNNPIKEEGSFKFATKSIFNDDYALQIIDEGQTDPENAQGILLPTDLIDFSTQDFSIELRHYLDLDTIIGGGFPTLFNITASGQGYLFRIIYRDDNRLRFQWLSPSNKAINQTPIFKGWSHIVVTFKHGVRAKISLNGNILSSTDDVNLPDTTQSELQGWFITSDGNASHATGYGRGLRIYDKALTDAEIADLYNSDPKNIQTVPVSAQGNLIQELLCNQEQSLNVNDSSSNDEDLQLQNYSNAEASFGGGAWVNVSAI